VDRGRALLRGGGREGDTVWVSGRPGEAVIGLEVARGELPGLAAEHRAALKARYDLPDPRLSLGQGLVGIASAALDVSD
ncbi:thiamine-phosphate kinase, partial [Tritonibacter sp. SIMBA_163]